MKTAPIGTPFRKGERPSAKKSNILRDMCMENRVEVASPLKMTSSIAHGTLIELLGVTKFKTQKVVTGVTWNGTVLALTYQNLLVADTSTTDASETIDTPTAC